MKNRVIFLLAVVFTGFGITSFAQSFGIKAGLNLSVLYVPNIASDLNMNPGFHAGPVFERPVSGNISLESGIFLTTKGMKNQEDFNEIESKMNLYYIEVPISAKGTVDLGNSKIYGLIGPYFGIGVGGKTTFNFHSPDGGQIVSKPFESKNIKRLDYGIALGGGVNLNNFLLGLGYDLGLANISNDEEYYNRV